MELIVRPENNPQTRLFIFKGAEASFPLAPGQQRIFYSNDIIRANPGQKMLSPEDAEKRGYFLAYNLVRDSRFEGMETKIHSVTAETIQLKSGLIDMMSVTLKTGYSWDENGFERIITNQIRTNFINRGIPPYRSPDAGRHQPHEPGPDPGHRSRLPRYRLRCEIPAALRSTCSI